MGGKIGFVPAGQKDDLQHRRVAVGLVIGHNDGRPVAPLLRAGGIGIGNIENIAARNRSHKDSSFYVLIEVK